MAHNVFGHERVARVILGSSLLLLAAFAPYAGPWLAALGVIGALTLVTAASGHCPLTAVLAPAPPVARRTARILPFRRPEVSTPARSFPAAYTAERG